MLDFDDAFWIFCPSFVDLFAQGKGFERPFDAFNLPDFS